MNRPTLPPDDSWESDAVWTLLDKAAPSEPRASFADDVVRAAKLLPAQESWWKRLLAPGPIAGLAAATAAVALSVTYFSKSPVTPLTSPSLAKTEPAVQADPYAAIQEVAETETLIAASDHLEEFSDQELASLIGF